VSRGRGKRKTMVGIVVSDRMDKTVVVRVETLRRHPLYKKTIRHIKKVKAHDEENACRIGDKVLIMETRPLSREKRWRVVQILERVEEAVPVGMGEALEGPQGG